MNDILWKKLTQVDGLIQAEVLKSYLEANEVPVELVREAGTPSTYPFTVDDLASVDVYAPIDLIERARDLLALFNTPPTEEEQP